MRKRDFVVAISNEYALVQADVAIVIQRFLEMLGQEFAAGKRVELRNFGVFEFKVRKSRIGRNPNQPENEVLIPERVIVRFRPGKELKAEIGQISPAKTKRKAKKASCK